MDLMQVRRRMLLNARKVDTSPKIAVYGKACATSATGERDSETSCITEWYDFDPAQKGLVMMHYYIKNLASVRNTNYQYTDDSGHQDWYYSRSDYTRQIGWSNSTLQKIRFTIVTADMDDVYAYCETTGQIFFAGRNTAYWGYTNINDMPSS